MWTFIKKQPVPRLIAFGFLFAIILGSVLLILPWSVNEGVELKYIDALYTSTSAVCVTGLIAVDAKDTFTPLGQFFLAMLIQVGGLGVTSIGAGVILLLGKKFDLKGRNLVQEASNLDSGKGVIKFIKDIFITTIIIELIGAILSFIVFVKDYPIMQAIGISLFHSIAAFNNSGFDILGNLQNLIPYQNNVLLNIVTSGLIIFGGIGFLVIKEVISKKLNWKKFTMHTKIVLSVTLFLLVSGTILIKLTEQNDITWLGAFFFSVSARTAGFSTYSLANFREITLLVIIILMFIGASPGSTGGGIKTTTFFVLFKGIIASSTNKSEKAFKYSIPKDDFRKSSIIVFLALIIIFVSTFLILVFETNTNVSFMDAVFEMTSAFGTVGLSTGITPDLSIWSKLISILVMYIGRLGPMTIATLWYFSRGENIRYPEGDIAIG